MKKKLFKNAVSILVLALLLSCTSALFFGVSATDEASDLPCGGEIEEVEVDILFTPLSSRIVIGGSEPIIAETVLKITYPNGESEILTVEQDGNRYYAGEFSVSIPHPDSAESDYGFIQNTIDIYNNNNGWGGYMGEADFIYIKFPSINVILHIISSHIKK